MDAGWATVGAGKDCLTMAKMPPIARRACKKAWVRRKRAGREAAGL